MWQLHRQGAGGIVGDEMGLGKTVQVWRRNKDGFGVAVARCVCDIVGYWISRPDSAVLSESGFTLDDNAHRATLLIVVSTWAPGMTPPVLLLGMMMRTNGTYFTACCIGSRNRVSVALVNLSRIPRSRY